MKVCVIQPPYAMDCSRCDEYFEKKLEMLASCDPSLDLIVLPEDSEIPCAAMTKEENFLYHDRYIQRLLKEVSATAKRCSAVVFVNALFETETGFRNTTYAYGKDGELIGQYFKRHLPPLELHTLALDHSYIDSFSPPYVLEYDGLRYAFLTCYDFYFYEAFPTIARQNVDIIIGCSLQRSDSHDALEMMGRFLAYNCNAHLVRASVSLGENAGICGSSMVVTPRGEVILNMKSRTGLGIAEFDPKDKYYKPAGFGGAPAPHYEYIEFGRRPWEYRPAGSAIVQPNDSMPYPRVCAHRGFNTVAPENSLPAFGAAVALGAQEIEFDLWVTKDGEIVSIHDNQLDRVSDGSGLVYEKTYEELLQYDFGAKFSDRFRGLPILRFEDILAKFSCHTIMNVHIKSRSHDCEYNRALPRHLKRIVALIDRYDCRKYVYFMSGDDRVLEALQQIAPDIARCAGEESCVILGEQKSRIVERAVTYGCEKIQFFKPFFDQDAIDRAHAAGLKCNIFWSDDAEEAKRLLEMGIDTILSNDYYAVSQVLKQ